MYATIFISQFKGKDKDLFFHIAKNLQEELHASFMGNIITIQADTKQELEARLQILIEASSLDFVWRLDKKNVVLSEYQRY